MKCKVSNFLLLALALSTVLMSGVTVTAKKPLYCTKYLDIYPAGSGEPYLRGPIRGGIDGYYLGYSLDPLAEKPTGQVTHYRERWEIWDETMKVKLLNGTNTALVNMRKLEWQAQGVVEWVNNEFENGRYADLMGCKWHSRGIFIIPGPVPPIYIQLVDTAFRIN